MKKNTMTVRRILCLLLCLSMLPLVNVSAAGYSDAYQALIKWAKQGEYTQETGSDGTTVRIYWNTDLSGPYYEVAYFDFVNGDSEDFVGVTMVDEATDSSYRLTQMYLNPPAAEDYYVIFRRDCVSERKDGTTDSYGNYRAEAWAAVMTNQTLDSGFDMYECDTSISKTKVQKEFKQDVKKVVEFADKIIRANSSASIQNIFSKVTPQSIHTAGRSWVEKAETCTQDGTMGYQCSVCGAKYYEPIKAGHKWEITEVTTPATDVHGYGQYTCSRCGETKNDEICISSAFTDMPAKENWAHAGIDWAVYNNITKGMSATSFGPDIGCTRAQVVTFLWRAAGCPPPHAATGGSFAFTDVVQGSFYEQAVAWAVEEGITIGMTPTTFGPDVTCTRGQVVTFLWRFKGQPAPKNKSTSFVDLKTGGFYLDAVAWAVENGITNGTSRTEFSPGSTCTRAQVVTFLHRTQQAPMEPVELKDMVGISMPTEELVRWERDGTRMKEFLRGSGYDVELLYASNSPQTQISQIEKMITHGAKVIVVAAIDAEALTSTLKKARNAGIKVIAYERPIMDTDAIDYLVTFDNFEVGARQGSFIAEQLDLENAGSKSYNIEIIGGAPDDGNAYVFYDGAMSVLRPYIEAGTLNVVSGQVSFEDVATEGWSTENARIRFEQILKQYYSDKPLHAVMASNDSTAQGVVMALEKGYRNDVYPVITGQDCDIVSVYNMLEGKQAMSVIKDTRMLSDVTAGMARDILNGVTPDTQDSYFNGMTTLEVPTRICSSSVCTVENIKELLIDSGYYTEDEIYGLKELQ